MVVYEGLFCYRNFIAPFLRNVKNNLSPSNVSLKFSKDERKRHSNTCIKLHRGSFECQFFWYILYKIGHLLSGFVFPSYLNCRSWAIESLMKKSNPKLQQQFMQNIVKDYTKLKYALYLKFGGDFNEII